MQETIVTSYITRGLNPVKVYISTSIIQGVGVHLVGVNDVSVKEILLRTFTALQSLGYHIPGKKIVINIKAEDGLPVQGNITNLDLPVAVSILATSGQLRLSQEILDEYAIVGELGLDASVREIRSGYNIALAGMNVIMPKDNALQIKDAPGVAFLRRIHAVQNLNEAVSVLQGCTTFLVDDMDVPQEEPQKETPLEMNYISGCKTTMRAMEIAAAGGHGICLTGRKPGKKLLVDYLRAILPGVTMQQYIESEKIYQVLGKHLTVGAPAPVCNIHAGDNLSVIVGGGSHTVLPGKVSLAHNGILVLDELTDLSDGLFPTLKNIMRDSKVTISRLREKVEFPSAFLPVGKTDDEESLKKTHGCFDISCEMEDLGKTKGGASVRDDLPAVSQRVAAARRLQEERYRGTAVRLNADLEGAGLKEFCTMDEKLENMIQKNAQATPGFISKVKRIARTIADLEGSQTIEAPHVIEAMSLVSLD